MAQPRFVVLVSALAVIILCPPSVRAQTIDLAGRWTLNRELSQFPREIGFDADLGSTAGPAAAPSSRGRRGGRGAAAGGGTAGFTAARESEEDAQRLQLLTGEVRNPPAHLTIAEDAGAVTMTDDGGQSRTFHPDGRQEELHIGNVPVAVIARREPDQLVVLYKVEQGRQLRYTYARTPGSSQLVVEVQFVQRRGGDHVRRVYEPGSASEATTTTQTSIPASAKPGTGQSTGSAPGSGPGRVPGVGSGAPRQTFNQAPGAELKGLKTLGIVVEDLSSQATACGLSHGAIEAAIAKRLSDAGFSVRRNSDEDTYLYVNIITTGPTNGLCISRYDAFLYTHTTATLSYQHAPVLVQVALLHKGGLVGGASSSHAEGVLRGLQDYVDQFTTRIRDANK